VLFLLPDAWVLWATGNSILRKLKMECTKEPGNPDFWDEVKKNKIGLITASEAAKHGGRSKVPDSSAEEVRRPPGENSPC
jgi:ATP-dependent DNA helicase 2 subunit 2